MKRFILISLIALTSLRSLANAETSNTSFDLEQPTVSKSDAASILNGPDPAWAELSDLMPVPDDATGLLYFRRNNVFVHLDTDGQKTYQNQRIKILDPRALDLGNLSLIWNPDVGSPVVHRLLVHRDDRTIKILEDNEFEILRREDLLEQSILNGYLTAILRIPDLRVGDELEWAFTLPSHDPTLRDRNYGLLALGGAVPSGRHKMGLSWGKGQKPTIRITDDLTEFEDITLQSVSITLDDPQVLIPPNDAPVRYGWQRIIEYTDFESWSAISRYFSDLFDSSSTLSSNSEIKEEAKLIAEKYSDDLDRTKAALKLLQQQVRYIYVGLDGGNFTPATADETWRRRYGDCKGKTALLLALLRELNIDVEVVLVNNSGFDDGYDDRLPSPGLFDHVLLRANVNGVDYWLDPTLPEVIEPSLQPFVPYRWVLPLSKSGHGLEDLGDRIYSLPQEMVLLEYDAREGFSMPARRIWTSVNRGINGLTEYLQYSALTSSQLRSGLTTALISGGEWNSVDDVSYRYDVKTQASILTITGIGPVDWEPEQAGGYDLILPGGGFSPPVRRQRSADMDETAPFYSVPRYSCYVTTVRLPDDTDLENWGYNSTYYTKLFGRLYYRMMERRDDRTISMVRISRVEKTEISPSHARRDNRRIADFDNSMARIEYAPNKDMPLRGRSLSVPATYEVDLTGADSSCQPDDTHR